MKADGVRFLSPLVHCRSDDLPLEWNSLLLCADVSNGTYFHMVGPLAQFFEQRRAEQSLAFDELMLDVLINQSLVRMNSENRNWVKWGIAELRDKHRVPLALEHVTTAAISTSLVARFLLQAHLHPSCRNSTLHRKCSRLPDVEVPAVEEVAATTASVNQTTPPVEQNSPETALELASSEQPQTQSGASRTNRPTGAGSSPFLPTRPSSLSASLA